MTKIGSINKTKYNNKTKKKEKNKKEKIDGYQQIINLFKIYNFGIMGQSGVPMKLVKVKENYTKVPNEFIRTKNFSLEELGMLVYLWEKTDSWCFSGERITKQFTSSRGKIYKVLKKLESKNYLYRERMKNGRVKYFLDSPHSRRERIKINR